MAILLATIGWDATELLHRIEKEKAAANETDLPKPHEVLERIAGLIRYWR